MRICSWQRPPGFGKGSLSFDLDAHIIPLSVATKRIMRKYSGEKFRPTHGISREIRQIMAARRFIRIASGALRTLIGPVTNAVPASIL